MSEHVRDLRVLQARFEASREREREAGFTLIELLVVVIIIGILAAIAIPVYLGVQTNAKDSAVKSDLTHARTAIYSVGSDNGGSIPNSIDAAGIATVPAGNSTVSVDLTKNGWSRSTNTTSLSYTKSTTTTGWCVFGSGITGSKFYVTDKVAVTSLASSATACPAGY